MNQIQAIRVENVMKEGTKRTWLNKEVRPKNKNQKTGIRWDCGRIIDSNLPTNSMSRIR